MRMRAKPWARPELAACPFNIRNPAEHWGNWKNVFAEKKPLRMELGCGKGEFVAQICTAEPDYNYLAIDIKSEVLVLAKRAVEAAYLEAYGPEKAVENVRVMSQDIERIAMMLAPEDEIDRIYINFCNPWPKSKHHKKRLTHTRQLMKYREFLKEQGEIWFKTDDDPLFEDSLEYFQESGFSIRYLTRDLHQSGFEGSYSTEHERMFSAQGIPIKFLIAVKEKEVPPKAEEPAEEISDS